MLYPRERRRFTPEEYLLLEERAEGRNELIDGEIFAMAGGSLEHNQIQGNLYRALSSDGPCRVYAADVRLFVEKRSLFTYPDLLVICGPPQRMSGRRDTVVDATLIAEVLSPSTRDYDRGDKFAAYRTLPSLSEYVVIEQDVVKVELHQRRGTEWVLTEYALPEDRLELTSLSEPVSVSLAELYRLVDIQPRP